MARAKITMVGGAKAKARLKAVPTEIESALRKEIFDAAQEVHALAMAAIDAPKSGIVYRKGGFSWRASAPGEAPAKKTGKNADLIKAKKSNRKGRPTTAIRGPKIYKMLAAGMSLGKPRQVLPRPLFGPIMQKYRNKFRDKVESTTRRVLRVETRRK